MGASIVTLDEVTDQRFGGKAFGLARLTAMGLAVPPAFVIRDATPGAYPADLDDHHDALGTEPVAVRSSAEGEDGHGASFAGQFATILDVQGPEALRAAIDRCVASVDDERARSYQQARDSGAGAGAAAPAMHLVVQRMVDARAAGVVFTADPVSARRDLVVVDAVAGLGEALVSGEATPDHYAVDTSGEVVRHDLAGDTAVLADDEVLRIVAEARRAAEHEGHPLDLEWAIDQEGELFWLQARPITTLPADLNEFDTVLPGPDDVLTTSNISEMMPGAVCPLTMSVTGWGIDYGLQHMQVSVGARERIDPSWQITASAYGHLFLNLTGNVVMSAGVLGSSADQTAQMICGRVIPELRDPVPMALPRRVANTTKLVRYCLSAPRVVDRFGEELAAFSIPHRPTSREMITEIVRHAWFFDHAMAVHIQSSALSGFLNAIVENMVAKTANHATLEEQAEAIRLLAGAADVESAVMLDELDDLTDAVAAHPQARTAFVDASVEDATSWLRSVPALARELAGFLDRHGHRGYRELCLRDPSWGDDPTPLVQSMQVAVHARLATGGHNTVHAEAVDLDDLGRGLRWVLPRAHAAVRRREHTKSQLVDVAHRFKLAYRHLGELLVDEGHLPDTDLVCFFTKEELPGFVAAPTATEVARAQARRDALEHQQQLKFPDISVGLPHPHRPEPAVLEDGVLHGRPASRGVTEGRVRVALTLAEAAALEPDEILVTPITDIGWTPYFCLIGGLVTDLGSSVSHGAVVAREYGLPCVVNARHATQVLRTGDRVRLDGTTGSVTVLEPASTNG